MRLRLLTLSALSVPLLLIGCGGDDGATGPPGSAPDEAEPASSAAVDPPDGGEASSAGGRQGQVTTDEGVYSFEASTCLVDDVEGEINGPGMGPDGEPVYVDLGFGEGYAALRIDLGTDDQFASSDEIVNIELDVEVAGSTVTGTGDASDEMGAPLGTASVEVDCG